MIEILVTVLACTAGIWILYQIAGILVSVYDLLTNNEDIPNG